MSLFGNLYMGAGAVEANRLALQVVGNNLANASTAGYIREDVDFSPVRPSPAGGLLLGNGVNAQGVVRQIDKFLAERARAAGSHFEASSARSSLLQRVERSFNELTDTDLSTLLSDFFGAIHDLASRPNDPTLRTVVVSRGVHVAETIQAIRQQIDQVRADVSTEVRQSAAQVNASVQKIETLNRQIVAAESAANGNEANGLRTIREQELAKLGKLIDFRLVEQPNGSVNLYSGNEFLLFDGEQNRLAVREDNNRGLQVATLVFESAQTTVPTTGGRIGGIQGVRDDEIAKVVDALDQLTRNLIFEFNKIHSSGQGLQNFTSITSTQRVYDPAAVLTSSQANLPFKPNNGSFEIRVTNKTTGQSEVRVIPIDLDGIGTDDSLQSVAAKLNAPEVLGLGAATVTAQGELKIQAPPAIEFSFANDTSGFLAALGLNTFFTGRDSRDIAVADTLRENPSLFAAATNGEEGNVANALTLAQFHDQKLASLQDRSLADYLTAMTSDLGAMSDSAKTQASTQQTTKSALESEHLSIAAVSLDEEAVKLLAFQRSFQASARYVSAINALLDEILGLVG